MDDELSGCIWSAVAIGLAVIAVGLAIWIAVALLVRLLAIVVTTYLVLATMTFVSGSALGTWIPLAVLTGRGTSSPVLLTPDRVVAGNVFRSGPSGPAEHYGWDRAWPAYIPFQARRDASAVRLEVVHWLRKVGMLLFGPAMIRDLSDGSEPSQALQTGAAKAGSREHDKGMVDFLRFGVMIGPFLALFLGIAMSLLIWTVVMVTIALTITIGQRTVQSAFQTIGWFTLARRKASMVCTHCYAQTRVPSYECVNTDCPVVHRDIRSAKFGVLSRRCECGSNLPTTVLRASLKMKARCPICDASQSDGAGTRRTILVPVIGEPNAGKTRLLASAMAHLSTRLSANRSELVPLSQLASNNMVKFTNVVDSGRSISNTSVEYGPLVYDFGIEKSRKRPVEIHFIDVAGQHFSSWESTRNLRYLDNALALLFVIDPLALDHCRTRLERSNTRLPVQVAPGRAIDAYSSAVDRMQHESVPLHERSLGVVLTKADVLREVSVAFMGSTHSASIRDWLMASGEDRLVKRMELDFGRVEYFMVDSMSRLPDDSTVHPLRPVSFIASLYGTRILAGTDLLLQAAPPRDREGRDGNAPSDTEKPT